MHFDQIKTVVLFFPIFLFSLSFHEMAHAWMAHRCGDDTARLQGRLTLNPIPHIDIFGTILLPLLIFTTSIGLPIGGWAKPVPVNPLRMKKWRQDMIKVSVAGPISNLILALATSGVLYLLYYLNIDYEPYVGGVPVLHYMVLLNLGLAFFNLIPIHPLDGGKVLENFLSPRWRDTYNAIAHQGIWILFAAYYFGLFKVLAIPVYFVAHFLIPG